MWALPLKAISPKQGKYLWPVRVPSNPNLSPGILAFVTLAFSSLLWRNSLVLRTLLFKTTLSYLVSDVALLRCAICHSCDNDQGTHNKGCVSPASSTAPCQSFRREELAVFPLYPGKTRWGLEDCGAVIWGLRRGPESLMTQDSDRKTSDPWSSSSMSNFKGQDWGGSWRTRNLQYFLRAIQYLTCLINARLYSVL